MPLTLKPGAAWLAGYATAYTLSFKEVFADTEQGRAYTQTIEGFFPGESPEITDLMDLMDGNYFVVQIQDPQKRSRLVGGHGHPLLFSSSFDSGLNRSDAKGYQFSFTAQSEFKAPYYL